MSRQDWEFEVALLVLAGFVAAAIMLLGSRAETVAAVLGGGLLA